MMILALMMSATLNCNAIAPDLFMKGAENYCSAGAFSEVEFKIDEEYTEAELLFTLNAEGFEAYSASPKEFSLFFASIIEKYVIHGVSTHVRFYFGGQQLVHCYPDYEQGATVCEQSED